MKKDNNGQIIAGYYPVIICPAWCQKNIKWVNSRKQKWDRFIPQNENGLNSFQKAIIKV